MSKRKTPPLYPCQKNGMHEVVNIKELYPDEGTDGYLIAEGYKWRAKCKRCGGSIVAKDVNEYDKR